jgi:hypothetical protein
VYALLRSGDLLAAETDNDVRSGPLRINSSSVERWLVAGGDCGRPLSPRNAWALIGLASGDQPFSEKCVGLLEHADELSRTRARLARANLMEFAPRLRRRAMLLVRHLPQGMREPLEHDSALVRSRPSAAAAYRWAELVEAPNLTWELDAYISQDAFSNLQGQLNSWTWTARLTLCRGRRSQY